MTKKIYVVQYNDCYGNGNKTLETIVESYEHFQHWLKEQNEQKRFDCLDDIDFVGDMEEEFDLIPLNLAQSITN
jgi:hypothetical protein